MYGGSGMALGPAELPGSAAAKKSAGASSDSTRRDDLIMMLSGPEGGLFDRVVIRPQWPNRMYGRNSAAKMWAAVALPPAADTGEMRCDPGRLAALWPWW